MSFACQIVEKARRIHVGGGLELAEMNCLAALAQAPDHPGALDLLGMLCYQSGRHRQAEDLFRRALAVHHDKAAVYHHLGLVQQALGNHSDACMSFEQAIRINPCHAEVYNDFGNLLLGRRAYNTALDCYRQALTIRQDFTEAYSNLAIALIALGQAEQAVAACQAALAIEPHNPALYFNLAVACSAKHDTQAALHYYKKTLALNPDDAEAHNNLGAIYRQEGRIDEAARCFSRALTLSPGYVDAMGNLADCLASADRLDQARQLLEQAIALEPDRAALHYNLGNTLKAGGGFDEAIDCYNRSLMLAPDDPKARWNRALALLALGRFTEAWPDFEQRFAKPDWKTVYPFRHPLPLWDGIPFNGRLLVHDEQGFGDTIQFVRFLPQVKAMGMTVVFETRRPLHNLMATAGGIEEIVERPAEGPCTWDCQARIPLMSLSGVLNTTVDAIPAQVPYLRADRQKNDTWRRRLAGPGFKVGLVWSGNPNHGNDKNRSIALERFGPLAKINGVRLFGLQKGPAAAQPGRDLLEASLGEELNDFTDTAALMSALDLIVTVDTAAAHLAGALGRPVWVLVPALRTDWRWLTGRSDSPWYPTMRVWRQLNGQGWTEIVALMAQVLADHLTVEGLQGV